MVRAGAKTGPKGRDDVFRPADCPDRHGGRIRIDRIAASGPFHTRVGYRCCRWVWNTKKGRWTEARHRFTDRSAEDPLPRRHPTCDHPYQGDTCAMCETTYAPDEGPRSGRHFWFAAHDIAGLLMGVTKGDAIQPTIADVRRDAARYRKKTRSHLPDIELPPRPERPPVEPEWHALPFEEEVEARDADDAREPDWLADAPPAEEQPRPAYRGWGERVRIVRGELALLDALPSPAEMVGDERFLSRSFALGAEYVDVFGPAVCAPHRREIWPDAIAIDSLPLNRRRTAETPSEMEVARTEADYLCEVFGVLDATTHELILLYPAGTKDSESAREVLAQKRGRPTWVVTDGDPALAKAVDLAFGPGTIHYRCEDHLRKNALDAAARDGILDTTVLNAIGRAQQSPEAWAILKRTVAARAPGSIRLRRWIADNEELVLHQVEIRRRFPGRPRSTGALEGHLVVVRESLDRRRLTLRNRRRLVAVLDLIQLGRSRRARIEQFRSIVRVELERTRDRAITWEDHWDHRVLVGGRLGHRNTIIEYRDAARRRNHLARADEANRASIERVKESFAEARREAEAAGGVAPRPRPAGRSGRRRAADDGGVGLAGERRRGPVPRRDPRARRARVPLGLPGARGGRSRRALAGPPAPLGPGAATAGGRAAGLPLVPPVRGVPRDLAPHDAPEPLRPGGVGLREERRAGRHARQRLPRAPREGLVAVPGARPVRGRDQGPGARPRVQEVRRRDERGKGAREREAQGPRAPRDRPGGEAREGRRRAAVRPTSPSIRRASRGRRSRDGRATVTDWVTATAIRRWRE